MSKERDEFKECSHCKRPRLRTEYAKKSDSLDGLQSWCKICMRNRPERRPKRQKLDENIYFRKKSNQDIYFKPINKNKLDLLIQSVLIYHRFYRN